MVETSAFVDKKRPIGVHFGQRLLLGWHSEKSWTEGWEEGRSAVCSLVVNFSPEPDMPLTLEWVVILWFMSRRDVNGLLLLLGCFYLQPLC